MTQAIRKNAQRASRAGWRQKGLFEDVDLFPSRFLRDLKPTVVFDTYWRFATERQNIFFRRAGGELQPWTEDAILRDFRFTNVYRASDRVSQYLIKNVIYNGDTSPKEVFFRVLLFKIFNKIETWELLNTALGDIHTDSFRVSRYDRVLSRSIDSGNAIYSAAYIMPSGPKSDAYRRKHQFHLSLLSKMLTDRAYDRIMQAGSLEGTFDILKSYPSIGPFLAYQYSIDLNYSELLNADEMEFVVAGPGALDGISKCFAATAGANPAAIIREVAEVQELLFERLGLQFKNLHGRRLQLVDCQNIFCEISKYARVCHPEFAGTVNRKRIKQKFRPAMSPQRYWFPPKWRLNDGDSWRNPGG